jgi:hypothetical protein
VQVLEKAMIPAAPPTGSEELPLPVTSVDDGSLMRATAPHEEICSSSRVVNEAGFVQAVSCPFQGQKSWILKRPNPVQDLAKSDVMRGFYGLGYMAQVLVYDKQNNTVAPPLYTSGWKYSDWDDNY